MRMLKRAAGLAWLCASVAAVGNAQDGPNVTDRVQAIRDGEVRMAFAARDGVCGDGSGWIRTAPNRYTGRGIHASLVGANCEPGPVRVALQRQNGRTIALETVVGGSWGASAAATDLGMVSAEMAVSYLLEEIEQGTEAPAKDAILPLTIAEASVPWMRLLDVARNATRPRGVRVQALFWAAQAAGEKASADIGAIAHDDPDVEVRTQAVFALSRREDGVVHLLSIARTSTDREVKRTAYFWLGQSRDPRATELFAEVLGRP